MTILFLKQIMNIFLKRISAHLALLFLLFQTLVPSHILHAANSSDLIYPLKEISKLECRFEEFNSLSSACKEDLPILKTKDYEKYASQNGGYNDFTRLYTVLWGASYKYGWDVWNGGHQGTDFATAKGTPVYTIANGTVINVWNDIWWGKFVSIEHTINGQKIVSNYAHLSKITVNDGERVDIGEKIWEVWSTGNSTWNHLHFQIDRPSTFHPYYYDWNACPYSYYKITEEGVCFDELQKNTFDPLEFLETNGAILEETNYSSSNTVSVLQNTQASSSNSNSSTTSSKDIFATTVYYGYGTSDDVKEIQRIYNKLGYYDWRISGDFEDLEESIIEYQLDTEVLENREQDGAGWFWPKTRAQTKVDYDVYVANGGQQVLTVSSQNIPATSNSRDSVKISKVNLMTREEREAQEVQNFLGAYELKLGLDSMHMSVADTTISELTLKTSRWKVFRGTTPGNISFEYDKSKVSIFPESFYHFVDGSREIHITALSEGNTTIEVKIWDTVVKKYSITVWWEQEAPKVESAKIYMNKEVVLWDTNRGIVLMQDQYDNKLVRTEYDGRFNMVSDDAIEYCIKRGSIETIRETYVRKCYDSEYKSDLEFDYSDTIAGLLLFEYRVLDTENVNMNLELGSKKLSINNLEVEAPKGLSPNYEYYNESIEMIQRSIATDLNQWYFLENRAMSEKDAYNWISNASGKTFYSNNFDTITRQDFLDIAYEAFGSQTNKYTQRNYTDLDSDGEIQVASLLGSDYEWQDKFWDKYFQPDKSITRGEAAYMLSHILQNSSTSFIARQ